MKKKIANNLGLALRAKKLVFGVDKIIELMRNGKIELVIITTTASFNTQKLIQDKAKTYKVDVLILNEIDDITLSSSLGKTNIKVVGIKDLGFKKLILNNIKE